jgi:hypothetical protein
MPPHRDTATMSSESCSDAPQRPRISAAMQLAEEPASGRSVQA